MIAAPYPTIPVVALLSLLALTLLGFVAVPLLLLRARREYRSGAKLMAIWSLVGGLAFAALVVGLWIGAMSAIDVEVRLDFPEASN